MEFFFSILSVLIGTRFAFLHTALATNTDLGPTFAFHLLQAVAAWSNEQPKKVNLWKLFDWYVNLLRTSLGSLLLEIFNWRPKIGVILQSLFNEPITLILKLLPVSNLTGVRSASMRIVSRWR